MCWRHWDSGHHRWKAGWGTSSLTVPQLWRYSKLDVAGTTLYRPAPERFVWCAQSTRSLSVSLIHNGWLSRSQQMLWVTGAWLPNVFKDHVKKLVKDRGLIIVTIKNDLSMFHHCCNNCFNCSRLSAYPLSVTRCISSTGNTSISTGHQHQ